MRFYKRVRVDRELSPERLVCARPLRYYFWHSSAITAKEAPWNKLSSPEKWELISRLYETRIIVTFLTFPSPCLRCSLSSWFEMC
jgi:hypothetical protein